MSRTFIASSVTAAIGLLVFLYLWNDSKDSQNESAGSNQPNSNGSSRSGLPSNHEVPSRRIKHTIDDEAARFRKEWGVKMNPAGDCLFETEGDLLRITVPGSEEPHDLNPEAGTPGSDNAPRVLKPVNGDFIIQVKMNAVEDPGEDSTQPGFTGYVGAGLVVFADAKNFVRLERATLRRPGGDAIPYTNFEIRVDGVTERFGSTGDLPTEDGRPTWLRIERRGSEMHGAMSHDGETWTTTDPKTLSAEVWDHAGIQAGIAAVSTSIWSFKPEYSDFSIIQVRIEPDE
ncbi:DUF1349 domain-containing protein [Haloferula sp.]|uniref:DUF1349 domain-containing protein n=1 Tax=Haloferula sp. TaxID=2497595 RepID=UPI00329AB5CA